MIRAFAIGAILAWAAGAVAMLIAAWIWLRAGRPRWMLIPFTGGLMAQAGWVFEAAMQGLPAVVDPATTVGVTGWAGWTLGMGGLAGLVSGMRRGPETGRVNRSNRAPELGLGLLGLGLLLQHIAMAL